MLGGVLLVVLFVFQLFLCKKARRTSVKLIPLYGLLLMVGFILLTCLDVFGTGNGFIGNINMLVAEILAVPTVLYLVGIVSTRIVYCCQLKRRR